MAQVRDHRGLVRAAPAHRFGRIVRQPVAVAVHAEVRGELRMLVERPLELAVEECGELLVGRGLGDRRGGKREEGEGAGAAREAKRGHSTLPICCTTLASFFASASQKAWNCGWSRYWIGVSTLASADWNVASLTAAFAASRSFATTASGVPAGTKSPVHCENCASYPSSRKVGTSGSAGCRLSPQDASTRILPPLRCPMIVEGPVESASTWPPRSATTAGPAPGKGTCSIFTPPAASSLSIGTCIVP